MSNNQINIKFSGWLSTLLTVLFIGLKLTNHIDWSWWWVLSPLWIGLAIGVLVLIIVLFFLLYIIMRRKFYVTIQLSNGGIESLFIDLNEGELATEEMFADKIEEWWHMNCKYMSDSDKYIESHIIAWSQIETE